MVNGSGDGSQCLLVCCVHSIPWKEHVQKWNYIAIVFLCNNLDMLQVCAYLLSG
jgi:hypothetical protein